MSLPPSWKNCILDDVLRVVSGFAFKSSEYEDNGHFLIRIGNVQDGRIDLDNPKYVKITNSTKKFELNAGDILTSLTGNIGRVARISAEQLPAALNQRVARLEPVKGLDNDYIYLFLCSAYFRDTLASQGKGAAQQNVSPKSIGAIPFPLPPLKEQSRIVAKLDSLTAYLGRASAELDRVTALIIKLRQELLSDVWRRTLDAPLTRVGDIAETTFDGPFGSNLKSADYSADGVRVVRLENIGHLRFIVDRLTYITKEKYSGLMRHTLQPDDIIFSSFVDQQIRVCQFPDDVGVAINKADCFVVRAAKETVDARFVTYMLASPETYQALKTKVHGATRPRIALSHLRELELHLPQIDEQRLLANQLDKAFARADRLEAETARCRVLINRIEAALLKDAFRGRLVPQIANEEPTSALLECISAERAPKHVAKRGRPSKAEA